MSPADRYAERFLIHSVDPWLHSNTLPGERVWDIDHLLPASVLRFLRARNRQGFGIYLLSYAEHGNAGYIFLDLDHPMVDVVPLMQAHGQALCVSDHPRIFAGLNWG